jgi:2-polyprenyl-3-methyl-5-hydroxy-6-metoxy-1,4-benzoquinol methylase
MNTTPAVNEEALNQMLGKMVADMGAAASGALIVLGDRLGLYKALAEIGPASSEQLAKHAGLNERCVREWLACQAASGYVAHDAASGAFSLTPEQAAVLADPDSPVLMTGGYYAIASLYIDEEKAAGAFRTGKGLSWGEHHACLFCGTERFFRPGYAANIAQNWIPALDDVGEKLAAGARVADIGCGFGSSTLIMARAYPNSEFVGFDLHGPSIDHANNHARTENLRNLRFEQASAQDFPGSDYDFVTIFDALHDMGDPVGAAAHVLRSLKSDGTWMIVEPMAGDNLEENLNPVGRVFYAFSAMVCTPGSMSQPVGLALGAQAGEARLRTVATHGGFTRFRRAAETPFNLILEARP